MGSELGFGHVMDLRFRVSGVEGFEIWGAGFRITVQVVGALFSATPSLELLHGHNSAI